ILSSQHPPNSLNTLIEILPHFAQAEWLAVRSQLKREYLLQYNDPSCHGVMEDPALTRWTYTRSANTYPNFRPTPRSSSLLGALFGIGPVLFWYYVFKTDRDRKEKLIREGKLDRTINISY
uniref:NADH dehydrogenase [ubiquinone] 1 beta subcomplex subunit 4 n=1 Tax=Phocoena sinus TaxID=42100 RepID=A0A8C9BCV7_PHOSS